MSPLPPFRFHFYLVHSNAIVPPSETAIKLRERLNQKLGKVRQEQEPEPTAIATPQGQERRDGERALNKELFSPLLSPSEGGDNIREPPSPSSSAAPRPLADISTNATPPGTTLSIIIDKPVDRPPTEEETKEFVSMLNGVKKKDPWAMAQLEVFMIKRPDLRRTLEEAEKHNDGMSTGQRDVIVLDMAEKIDRTLRAVIANGAHISTVATNSNTLVDGMHYLVGAQEQAEAEKAELELKGKSKGKSKSIIPKLGRKKQSAARAPAASDAASTSLPRVATLATPGPSRATATGRMSTTTTTTATKGRRSAATTSKNTSKVRFQQKERMYF